jgi:two-component system sensor histidine kinase KdpD
MSDLERDALDVRPSADQMLARVRAEEADPRGRLRVYLGMAPGVGKTYRMLEEGARRRARGTDVVVGFVETHRRPSTEAMIGDLELIPRLRVEHRGVAVEDLDTAAVIRRRPTVALIDELAHTNVPGAPHAKRWEDVEAIRDAGIHVVTTLNVQHLDSQSAAVETITGAPVHERLPDSILASADEVELVDMSPHALRQRMRHGNVYPPERTAIALDRFFTEANLTALRELSLRTVARRVEDELEDVAAGRPSHRGALAPRIGVLIDGTTASGVAVRRAADLAAAVRGELIALVPDLAGIPEREHLRVRTIREETEVAADLGAAVVRIDDGDAGGELVEAARRLHLSHLLVPLQPAAGLGARLRGPSLVERVASGVPGIEVHVVTPPSAPG